ncbi:MAG: YdcF family protein [Oscillospiraceae bacterium]|nr:YdcF family protein [Oscillospiraceae bacterium]
MFTALRKPKFKKIFKRTVCILLAVCLLGAVAVTAVNAYVMSYASDYILDMDEVGDYGFDCVMVLGAGLWDGEPSPMLKERLNFGLQVYDTGCTDRMLMSGDHGQADYDEVNTMKAYAADHGVPPDNVFMDHAGFSTYESMYRARDVFDVEKMVIVTQSYHLYRAVYDARKLGIDAYGVKAEKLKYSLMNDVREAAARTKDFIWCIAKPEPTYLGEEIPISASGSLTDDKTEI